MNRIKKKITSRNKNIIEMTSRKVFNSIFDTTEWNINELKNRLEKLTKSQCTDKEIGNVRC